MITEAYLRQTYKRDLPEVFAVPEGMALTPAAREHLQMNKVRIEFEARPGGGEAAQAPSAQTGARAEPPAAPATPHDAKYIDDSTHAAYFEKPEFMTHLSGNRLVLKNHPRIALRGKLDSLQSAILIAQAEIGANAQCAWLVELLEDVLANVRNLLRCEVMDEEVGDAPLMGLNSDELRDRSHHPQKYYQIPPMMLPHHSMGLPYLRLNALRSQAREAELAAMDAFWVDGKMTNPAFLRSMNRLSSAFHILMCQCAAAAKEAGGK